MNKVQVAKVAAKSLGELSESGKDLFCSMKGTAHEAAASQKLWREGNKSNLIKIGMAIFVFPEPTPISEIIGAGVMAAGAIQQGIKNQAIYAEDIPKTLRKTFKDLRETKYDFRV
jgi:hypothetical protein